jgi:6-phosphogluconolactonase (cycloisomerase 2 family)
MSRFSRRFVLAVSAALLVIATAVGSSAAAKSPQGAVFTLTNEASGNAVLAFARGADGTLTPAGSFATGGAGTGSGLGSQGALILSKNGRSLYAVNAGSNDVSVLTADDHGVSLVSKVQSRGVKPISLTLANDLLYVLNAGDPTHAANIAGFRVGAGGKLTALAGSTRPLSGPAVDPAQIQFSRDGRTLVVTEKATSLIDTYTVGAGGLAAGPNVQPSAGQTPFGFDFDIHGHLIVSDAFGGAPGASALSSYSLTPAGRLRTITPLAPDGQTAACWVVTTTNGRYAYTTNTGSANVSSYTIGPDGALSLLAGAAGSTGASPTDAALAKGSRYLYTLDSGSHTISAFVVRADGSLDSIPGAAGLPASAVGLAAR